MGQNNADYCGDQESRDGKECSGLWTNSGYEYGERVISARYASWWLPCGLDCTASPARYLAPRTFHSVNRFLCELYGSGWKGDADPFVTCPHGTWCATTTGAASRWPSFNDLVGCLKFVIVSFVDFKQLILILSPAYLFYSRASVDAHNSKLKYSAYYLLPAVSSPQLPLTTQCYGTTSILTNHLHSVHYSYSTLITKPFH